MKIQYENGEKEYARGCNLTTGVHWVIYRTFDYKKPFETPEYFIKALNNIKNHLEESSKLHGYNYTWEPMKMNIEDRTITADLLENELEDALTKLLSDFETQLNKQYAGKFSICIRYAHDVVVEVEEINKPKDKASKEIEEVLAELNKIYRGQYRFGYIPEEKKDE